MFVSVDSVKSSCELSEACNRNIVRNSRNSKQASYFQYSSLLEKQKRLTFVKDIDFHNGNIIASTLHIRKNFLSDKKSLRTCVYIYVCTFFHILREYNELWFIWHQLYTDIRSLVVFSNIAISGPHYESKRVNLRVLIVIL